LEFSPLQPAGSGGRCRKMGEKIRDEGKPFEMKNFFAMEEKGM
jgi:hypothetical protein